MKITWITKSQPSKDVDSLLELEYKFRSEITKLLLRKFDDALEDLDDVAFDFHTSDKTFCLADTTPEPFYSELSEILKDEAINYKRNSKKD